MHQLLIVDAEEDLLWALSKNLFKDRKDIKIRTASSGEDALEQIRAQRVDLLVTDTRVTGELDGFNLILRAKELVPRARLVVMTAFSTGSDGFAPSMGVAHFINKPFDTSELSELLLDLLEEGERFRGLLSDLSLADILALLCLCRRTVLLHLNHRGRRGRIEVVDGQLQHAEFDNRARGAEAVWTMLGLRQGDIFMQGDFAQSSRSIELPWQQLLERAQAWLDEHGLPEDLQPEVDIPVEGWDDDESLLGDDDDDDRDDDDDDDLADMPSRRARTRAAVPDDDDDDDEQDDGFGGLGENPLGFSQEDLREIEQAELPVFDPSRSAAAAAALSTLPGRAEDTLPRAPILRPVSQARAAGESLRQRPQTQRLGQAAISLDELVRTLRDEIPAFVACDIVHLPDGESIAGATAADRAESFDRAAAAAFYGELLRTGVRAANALAGGELDALQITTRDHYVLGRLVPGRPYAQLVMLARDGNLGIAQVVMRRLDASLAQAVPHR